MSYGMDRVSGNLKRLDNRTDAADFRGACGVCAGVLYTERISVL